MRPAPQSHTVTTVLVLAAVLALHVYALFRGVTFWLRRHAEWTAECEAESAAEQMQDEDAPLLLADDPAPDPETYGDVPAVPFTWAPWWEIAA